MKYAMKEFSGSNADYALRTKLWNAAWPEFARTEEAHRHDDKTWNEKHFLSQWFVELEGKTVALAEWLEEYESEFEGHYFIIPCIPYDENFVSLSEFVLQTALADLKSRNAKLLSAFAIEDRPKAVKLLEDYGFELTQREPRSALDVTTFDFARYANIENKLTQKGFKIYDLDELKGKYPDWQRRIYDLEWPIVKDMPLPFPIKREPFEDFQKGLDNPRNLPKGSFYAIDESNDKWVGLSTVRKFGADNEAVSVGLTGVIPEYRRKGIATALKVRTVDFAKKYGAKSIRTDNEENNPMYDLNMQLGFKPQPAIINYRLKLE
ncbi:MAG: GNAT family N-acetyltransferase [Chloroflexota bacterium]